MKELEHAAPAKCWSAWTALLLWLGSPHWFCRRLSSRPDGPWRHGVDEGEGKEGRERGRGRTLARREREGEGEGRRVACRGKGKGEGEPKGTWQGRRNLTDRQPGVNQLFK